MTDRIPPLGPQFAEACANVVNSLQGGPGQDREARRKQLLADAEAHRRERPTLDANPLVPYGRNATDSAVLDYAQAGTMIQLGIHHWDESIPSGQKVRTELAAQLITEGVVETLLWLREKGYDVPEMVTREELTRNLVFDPAQGHSLTALANTGFTLMEAIKEHMPAWGWQNSPAEVVKTLKDERDTIYSSLVTAHRVSIVSFLQWVASQDPDNPPMALDAAVEKFLAQNPDNMLADDPEAQRDNAMVDAFACHMKVRLAEKRALGKTGWQLPECLDNLVQGYLTHANGGNAVDAANYLAMLKIGHGVSSTPTLVSEPTREEVADQMREGLHHLATGSPSAHADDGPHYPVADEEGSLP